MATPNNKFAKAGEVDFVAGLCDALAPLGEVHARQMFGGWGVYADGTIFGLVAGGIFYLKAGEGNNADFDVEGLEPFSYEMNGKRGTMSYRRCPDAALDNTPLPVKWARKALAVAKTAKPPGKRDQRGG